MSEEENTTPLEGEEEETGLGIDFESEEGQNMLKLFGCLILSVFLGYGIFLLTKRWKLAWIMTVLLGTVGFIKYTKKNKGLYIIMSVLPFNLNRIYIGRATPITLDALLRLISGFITYGVYYFGKDSRRKFSQAKGWDAKSGVAKGFLSKRAVKIAIFTTIVTIIYEIIKLHGWGILTPIKEPEGGWEGS